ncbi:MAG: phosphatidylserine decarboxylase [Lachnospiraceae bacterium]|nr:phosphatidylserine decarboxylase [Lachnospiraceae bacterium]
MNYRNRAGKEYKVSTSQDRFLRFLYTNRIGKHLLKFMISDKLTRLIEWYMNTRISTLKIDPFIKKNKINISDYEKKFYESYNDFFTRKIKKSKRPINMDPEVLISPSDGKVTVYHISDRLIVNIKNIDYSIKSLLLDRELSEELEGGWLYVIRLTVDNYHRYCYPDSGYQYENYYIPGFFHTVNPVALENTSVFAQNCRAYTILDTDHFGRIIQMEVGAMGVGRIVNYKESEFIERGEEKGYFEFGGSTVCLFVPKGSAVPDADMIKNTAEGYETLVKMGEHIGRKDSSLRSE